MRGNKSLRSAVLILLLPLHCLAANISLGLTPLKSVLAPGESTFVDLVGTYDGADSLLGGAVSLSFRADLLEVVAVALLAPSDVAGTTGSVVINGNDGLVSGVGFATFVGVGGTFRVATVEFRAIGSGGASPLLAFDAADPVYAWVNEAFELVSVTSVQSEITVSAVPEVHGAATLFAGLAVLAAVAHRRRTPKGRLESGTGGLSLLRVSESDSVVNAGTRT